MSLVEIIFVLVAAMTLGAAVMVVFARKLMHSALWLIVALFGVAVIFLLLEAAFFAMVQIIVYVGAIAILIIFGVMLTRKGMEEPGKQLHRGWLAALLGAVVVFCGLIGLIFSWSAVNQTAKPMVEGADMVKELGVALVQPEMGVIPFEVASVLLLAALIGAIYLARERN